MSCVVRYRFSIGLLVATISGTSTPYKLWSRCCVENVVGDWSEANLFYYIYPLHLQCSDYESRKIRYISLSESAQVWADVIPIGGGRGQWLGGHHGECGARTYNGGLGADPSAGSRGRAESILVIGCPSELANLAPFQNCPFELRYTQHSP